MSSELPDISESIFEPRVAGKHVLTSHEQSRIRITRFTRDDESVEYSVQGIIPLERYALNKIMRAPLELDDGLWTDVRDDLRSISYPARRIKYMARTAGIGAHLANIKSASRELADILTNNQDYQSTSVNIPVFTYGDSMMRTMHHLYEHTSEKKILALLNQLGVGFELSHHLLQAILSGQRQPDEFIKELETMTGITDHQQQAIVARAIFDQVEPGIVNELIQRMHARQFVGFKEQVAFDGTGLVDGIDDSTVYVRTRDVPAVTDLDATNVLVGPKLRDADRSTDLVRHRVSFHTQAERHVAWPKLVWRKKDGQRTLAFPESQFVYAPNHVPRPNTIAGAALAASVLGADIDYLKAFEKLQGRNRFTRRASRGSIAGLWPLVADYKQDELLDNPYFEEIEDRLQ